MGHLEAILIVKENTITLQILFFDIYFQTHYYIIFLRISELKKSFIFQKFNHITLITNQSVWLSKNSSIKYNI